MDACASSLYCLSNVLVGGNFGRLQTYPTASRCEKLRQEKNVATSKSKSRSRMDCTIQPIAKVAQIQ